MTHHPLRNMRNNQKETRPQMFRCDSADDPKEEKPKGGSSSESIELWSKIQSVKDYVYSSGTKLIDSISGLCKHPKDVDKSHSNALQPLQSSKPWAPGNLPKRSLIRNDALRDFSTIGWRRSMEDTGDTPSWMINMLSDPEVSGETKFIISRMVELDYFGQTRSGVLKLYGNQWSPNSRAELQSHRLGHFRAPPRPSVYQARCVSGLPPLRPPRILSDTVSDHRAVTPYLPVVSPYRQQSWSTSKINWRRGSASFSGLGSGSPPCATDSEIRHRSRTVREFGLSPRESQRGLVTYSDPTITRALENYRLGRMSYTKEDPDKYNSPRMRQFVGHHSRLKLSSNKKNKGHQKRKSYDNRFESSSADRSRNLRSRKGNASMDIDFFTTSFAPDVSTTVTQCPTSPSVDEISMRSVTSSTSKKDRDNKTFVTSASTEPASRNSVFSAADSGVPSGVLFDSNTKPTNAGVFNNLLRNGGQIDNTSNTLKPSPTPLVKSSLNPSASPNSFIPLNTDAKTKLDKSSIEGPPKTGKTKIFDTSAPSKPLFFIPQTKKKVDKLFDDKSVTMQTAKEVETEILTKSSPKERPVVEHVSFVCRMAQMRRIKIKEHYTQLIESLYEKHSKDSEKETRMKKAVDRYQNKYHKLRQDHFFYTKLCEKFKVKPGNEYTGHDPDIKPDGEEEDKMPSPDTKQAKTKPNMFSFSNSLYGEKGSLISNPFLNNPFAVSTNKEPENTGFNFSGNITSKFVTPGKELLSRLNSSQRTVGLQSGSNLFSGSRVTSTSSVSVLGKRLQKDNKQQSLLVNGKEIDGDTNTSSSSFEKKNTSVSPIVNEIFKGCEKKSLWARHEGAMGNADGHSTDGLDGTSPNGDLKKGAVTKPNIFEEKAPACNPFGSDSKNARIIGKSSTRAFKIISCTTSEKSTGESLFGLPIEQNKKDQRSCNGSRGIFTGKNIFNIKAGNNSAPFATNISGSTASVGNIFTSKTNTKRSGTSSQIQASSNNVFSQRGNEMSNNNGFNISNFGKSDTKPQMSFGKVNGEPSNTGKRRRIVRGRRTMN